MQGVEGALVSIQQRSIWLLDQLASNPAEHVIPAAWRIRGRLDADALQAAMSRIARRHSALRTRYIPEGEEPVQVVDPPEPVPLPITELPGAAEPLARVQAIAADELGHRFDLANGPVWRARLLRLGAEDHVLLVVIHHIAADGGSMSVLWRELGLLYEEEAAPRGRRLPPPELQYADYAAWQRSWLESPGADLQLEHWRKALDGLDPLTLPSDRQSPPTRSGAGDSVRFDLPDDLIAGLTELGQRCGATLFMTLVTAFQVFLARLAGSSDIAVGVPVANRRHSQVEQLIGCFINTVVVRTEYGGDLPFETLLERVRGTVLDAFDNQDVPWEHVVRELKPVRDPSHTPVFQVIFVLQGSPDPLKLAGLDVARVELDAVAATFDLSLAVVQRRGCWRARLDYPCDLFDRSTVQAWAEHFVLLLGEIVFAPWEPVASLPIGGSQAKHETWAPRSPRNQGNCVHELVLEQARSRPEAVAVRCDTETVTYNELLDRASSIAAELSRRGVRRGAIVALMLDRSPWMMASMLGTLMAGAAYLALSAEDPPMRSLAHLEDAASPLVVTAGAFLSKLDGLPILCVEDVARGQAAPTVAVEPFDIAYVVFTSGSSGTPKGVLLEHGGVVNLVHDFIGRSGLGPGDRFLQFASPTFDGSVLEIFATLAAGAELVIPPAGSPRDPAALSAAIHAHGVTVFDMPPAVVSSLEPQSLPSVRLAMLGGEAFGQALVNAWATEERPLLNGYGPSEATVISTVSEARGPVSWRYPDIGRPIAGTRAYVLDEQLQPVLPRAVGTLWIAGDGVARGYLGRPGLTADRFRPDPFDPTPGARMYDTGDLARFRVDGGLDYLGRDDDQISLRGYRIEPGEVQANLAEHPAVAEALVSAQDREDGDRRLVAYVVPAEPQAPPVAHELRAFLSDRLPSYLIPNRFIAIEAIPFNRHGKVDRAALPDPWQASATAAKVSLRPRSRSEVAVAAAFAATIGLPPESVGVENDFFELGGYSLLALRVVGRLREELRVDLDARAIFEAPTVAQLAEVIDRAGPGAAATPIRPGRASATVELSSGQRRLWFLDQLLPGRSEYVIGAAWRLRGEIDEGALVAAIDGILRRHEILRTRFEMVDGQPVGRVESPPPLPLERSAVTSPNQLAELASDALDQPFDLTRAPLLRAKLFDLDDEEHLLLLTMHHAAADGWSVQVLARELGARYRPFREPAPAPTEAEIGGGLQYGDFAAWQPSWLDRPAVARQLGSAVERLRGSTPLELPVDRARAPVRAAKGGTAEFSLRAESGTAIESLGRANGATPYMTYLAVFAVLLHRLSGQVDLTIGIPVAGRPRPELDDLVGFFVNTAVVRADLSADPPFLEALSRLRSAALAALAQQDVPFEQLVNALSPERDLSRTPLYQAMFSLEDTQPSPQLDGLEVEPVLIAGRSAKTDLACILRRMADGSISGHLQYDAELFDHATVQGWAEHYETLLEGAAQDPERSIGDLALIDPAAQRRLISLGEGPKLKFPERCVHSIFEEQVAKHPEAVAIASGPLTISYRELDDRAGTLARRLAAMGAKPGVLVGLHLERSVELLVGVLGILKSGSAFVPLDPSYPPERLRQLLADCEAQLLVTRASSASIAPRGTMVCDVTLATDDEEHAQAENSALPSAASRDLAYVIYTSGSTGAPKGVAVEHAGVANLTAAMSQVLPFGPGWRILQFGSPSFDVFVSDIAESLLVGGTLCIASRDALLPGPPLAQTLRDERISFAIIPPSILAATEPGQLPDLRAIASGGEACTPAVVERWAPGRQFLNLYGPTEASVIATAARPAIGETRIPIGRPLANVTATICDSRGRLVPPGVAGELCLGGPGIARGYLNRRSLTAERFRPDPHSKTPGARIYHTGDRARMRTDGTIEYLGREDGQVKLRGYRIEAGEIEAALASHPAVGEAVVVLRETSRQRRLAAFVRPTGSVEAPALRRYLASRLPLFLVPHEIHLLSELPRTPNGKLDRSALPSSAERPQGATDPGIAPAPGLQSMIAATWGEVLCQDLPISPTDAFFDLGGDSLSATQATFRLSDELGVELPVRLIFEWPSLRDYANAIEQFIASPDAVTVVDVPIDDLLADATPSDDIKPAPRILDESGDGPVILTGATGFLGAFILEALLDAGVGEVVCLVRDSERLGSAERLAGALKHHGLGALAADPRVRIVAADLAAPGLGMDPVARVALERDASAIVHAAANVNLLASYRSLAGTNVRGTEELLRLACADHPKAVHHISTAATLARRTGAALTPETLVAAPDEAPRSGYGRSKWVAERLVLELVERGLPGRVYRPARIGPDSRSGAWNERDLLARLIIACLRLESVPDIRWAETLTPVDSVARSVVASLGEDTHSHRTPTEAGAPLTLDEAAVEARACGYTLKTLDGEEWLQRARASIAAAPDAVVHPILGIVADHLRRSPTQAATAPASDGTRRLVRKGIRWFARQGFIPSGNPNSERNTQ